MIEQRHVDREYLVAIQIDFAEANQTGERSVIDKVYSIGAQIELNETCETVESARQHLRDAVVGQVQIG